MKTRMFVYLIVVLGLVAMLSGVACRGREQPSSQQPPQPPPIGGPSATPFGGPPPQPPPGGRPSVTPFGGPPPQPQAVGQPDLVVSEATVTPTGNPGEVLIHISSRNQGGTITAAFTVRWHPHQKDLTQVGCSQDFYNLNQSEWGVDCTYTYPANQNGEMHWVAVVDAENDVKNESNENNNQRTGTVTIGGSGGPSQPPAGLALTMPTNCRTRIPTSGSGQVYVDWDVASGAAQDGFRIYQGTTSLEKTVGSGERSALISGLTRAVQYHFDVRAYNSAGESRADACSVDVTPPR